MAFNPDFDHHSLTVHQVLMQAALHGQMEDGDLLLHLQATQPRLSVDTVRCPDKTVAIVGKPKSIINSRVDLTAPTHTFVFPVKS